MEFWLLIKRHSNGSVASIYSPDLNRELIEAHSADQPLLPSLASPAEIIEVRDPIGDFRLYAKNALLRALAQASSPPIPKERNELPSLPLSSLDHWECIEINIDEQKKLFARWLPRIGDVGNVVSYLTGGFITYMALRIASHNEESSGVSNGLSIVGTLFSSTILLLVYIAAGTSQALSKIGQNIDQIDRRQITEGLRNYRTNWKFMLLAFLAWGATTAAIVITGVRLYQEMILLADKYLNLDSSLSKAEHDFYFNLIRWLVILNYIVTGGYCSIAFQGSFAMKLVNKYTGQPSTTPITSTQATVATSNEQALIGSSPQIEEGQESDANRLLAVRSPESSTRARPIPEQSELVGYPQEQNRGGCTLQ